MFPWTTSLFDIKGFYHQETDEFILVQLPKTLFYIIPSKRQKTRMFEHELTSYLNSSAIMLEWRKFWFLGGKKRLSVHHKTIDHVTKIYDVK